jgi:D-xylose transport system ATP-binding protein
MTDEPLLAMSGMTKRFGAVEALTDVDFTARAGEVVALVGDNGAGKSTLIKAVAGAQPADAGEVRFAGGTVSIDNPHDAQALGIATVYQDLALCENLDVVANLYLGNEAIAAARIIDEVAMERRTRALLDELAVRTLRSVRTQVASLSGGQRQTVAIARAMLGEPKLVLLDEPTAALGVAQTAQVLELIDRLRGRGMAVVVISHNLADVFQVADRIAVLRLGRNAGDYETGTVSQDDIVAAITGADQTPADGANGHGGHA